MHSVVAPLVSSDSSLPEVAICTDRRTLSQTAWRGKADDGAEFSFELVAPLRHGEAVFQSPTARYVIRQQAEPVLAIALDIPPSAAAGIGWAIGNMHLELSAEPNRLLAPDEPIMRQLLGRLRIPFEPTSAVVRPGRFARGGLATQDSGPSHRHPF
jgi:urease accessory protein